MNGIKKVFSHRNSASSGELAENSKDYSPEISPRSDATDLSSAANTSVDEHDKSATKMSGAAAGTGKTRTSATGTTANTTLGNGRSQDVSAADGSLRHSHGHNVGSADLSKGKVTQSVEHLGEITSKTNHTHNIEEVERQRELERHQHHIQVHHQPIKHEEHADEKLHQKSHPVTNINEKHASTDKDAKLLSTVAANHSHKNEVKHAPVNHQIVDQGEKVNESVHHHIHNVVVPLVSHDAHEHHRIKTTIPTHHVLHEAPIIHEAATLEPVSKTDFVKRGGVLGSSTKSVGDVNLLHQGTCDRKVDGVAEKLAKEMNLSSSKEPTTT